MRGSIGRLVRAGALTISMALAGVAVAKGSIPKSSTLETRATQTSACTRDTPVPILMYHHIGEKEDRFTISPTRLRAQIDTLRTSGYELQTFDEYSCCAPTTSGKPPAVLTFDDSTEDQYRILPSGKVDENSALGVLEGYRASHPQWRMTGTFFVNAVTQKGLPAFEQPGLEGKKLTRLQALGYEIGAHGYEHHDFRRLNPTQAHEDTRQFKQWINTVAPDVHVTSFAYPYGSIPPSTVRASIDTQFRTTAHAWGGTATTATHLVPRIEIGPTTVLAHYAPVRVQPRIPIAPPIDLSGPRIAFRQPDANIYKEIGVRQTYHEWHNPQLPPQPPRLHGRPDDRRRGWRGLAREGPDPRWQESHLLDGSKGNLWRDPLGAWQLWRPPRPLRDGYAWSSDWHPSQHPVILPYTTKNIPSRSDLFSYPLGPVQKPAAVTRSPAKPVPWYDRELSRSDVNAVLEARQKLPWWR